MSQPLVPAEFFNTMGRPCHGEELFDSIPDTVFFVKDLQGRYVSVNQTLVERCGLSSKSQLVGRTAREVFPGPLGSGFLAQDLEVIRQGRSIRNQLERHFYPGQRHGWCLTWKQPLKDCNDRIAGLIGISRDLRSSPEVERDLDAIAGVLRHVREHLDESLRLPELARLAQLSVYQLDQRVRALYGISAAQYITRCRIEAACHALKRSDAPVSRIALDCGYADQSAFTRQFRISVGLPPAAYRESLRE